MIGVLFYSVQSQQNHFRLGNFMPVTLKHIQYFLLVMFTFFALSACDNKSVDKNPKIAVQKSLENLFSKPFDFETQLINAQNKDETNSSMRLRYGRDLANIVYCI